MTERFPNNPFNIEMTEQEISNWRSKMAGLDITSLTQLWLARHTPLEQRRERSGVFQFRNDDSTVENYANLMKELYELPDLEFRKMLASFDPEKLRRVRFEEDKLKNK